MAAVAVSKVGWDVDAGKGGAGTLERIGRCVFGNHFATVDMQHANY